MLGPYQASVIARTEDNLQPLSTVHFTDSQMHIEMEACK